MKIVIPGGSGDVGTVLAREFLKERHEVVVLSRQPHPVPKSPAALWRVVEWDAQTCGDWVKELEGADVVINLAGRSVNCRYNETNRRVIMNSRVNSTRVVGEAIAACARPPRLWLQASTATIYAHRYDAPNDEITGIMGGSEPNIPDTWRFSIEVARAWEKTMDEAEVPHTRKVKMRSAITMSPDKGSAFDILLGLVRHELGGQSGDGKQYISWVHDQDFARAVTWIIEHENLSGVVNIASPNPLPNKDFMQALREAWGTRMGLPATAWMLQFATFFLRTETELVLKSRYVVPTRLLQDGFDFQFPDWPTASRDLCRRWREMNGK